MLEFDQAARAFQLAVVIDHLAEPVDRRIRPFLDLAGVVIKPDLPGNHRHRQRHGECLDEFARSLVGEGLDQLDRLGAHVGLDRVDPRGGEREVHQLAVAGVHRMIGGQQGGHVGPALGKDRLNPLIGLASHQDAEIIGVNLRLAERFVTQVIAVDDVGVHPLQQFDFHPGIMDGAVVIERIDQRFGGKHIAFGLVHRKIAPTLGIMPQA
jgi:hypothetical protein